MAAARLGIECVIFTPEEGSPASHVSADTIVADYKDHRALAEFMRLSDVISYEFENIPTQIVKHLSAQKPVFPHVNLLAIAQDRLQEKQFLNEIGIPTTRWVTVVEPGDVTKAIADWQCDGAILKTARLGYDGKGQFRVDPATDIAAIMRHYPDMAFILEEPVEFDCEISVIVARDQFCSTVVYGPVHNEHRNHILHRSTVPAPISPHLADRAEAMGRSLATSVDLIGILALELFVTGDQRLLANEIAPRTHNSGHWSIDACVVSQFENYVRAVCGLPVVVPGVSGPAEMLNLIGDDVENVGRFLKDPKAHVHLYGKRSVRAGRKMGHVTWVA
jgi:5-(carboxyamino)imidazole ribonucleotide synthase